MGQCRLGYQRTACEKGLHAALPFAALFDLYLYFIKLEEEVRMWPKNLGAVLDNYLNEVEV
jgi:hypothetical protein